MIMTLLAEQQNVASALDTVLIILGVAILLVASAVATLVYFHIQKVKGTHAQNETIGVLKIVAAALVLLAIVMSVGIFGARFKAKEVVNAAIQSDNGKKHRTFKTVSTPSSLSHNVGSIQTNIEQDKQIAQTVAVTASAEVTPVESAPPHSVVEISGEQLFKNNCGACHKADGTGNVGLAPSVRNRDFLAIASDEFISKTIFNGRAGTAMIPRPDLSSTQVASIITWLRSLEVKTPVNIKVDNTKTITGDAEAGHLQYTLFCSSCHGPNGEGYSAGGSGPGIGLPGFINTASDDYIMQTIKHGRIGTAMMGFDGATGLANLNETDMANIISFLKVKGGQLETPKHKVVAADVKPDAAKGLRLYNANCMACHQKDGLGKAGLAPSIRNRDFLAIASDAFIEKTITQGRAGTAMIPRADLAGEQVSHIIAYLRSVEVAVPVDITVDDHWKASGNKDSGKAKYVQYCGACHGQNGEGYNSGGAGPAIGLAGFLNVASDDFIRQTVKLGRIGTAMMSFDGAKGLAHLNESDIGDVIVYLRSLVDPGVAKAKTDSDDQVGGNAVEGQKTFLMNCGACHQPDGSGRPGMAPSIRNRDFLAIASDDFIKKTIKNGRVGTTMVARPDLSEKQVSDIIAFLRSLKIDNPVNITVDINKKIDGNAEMGAKRFAQHCAACHGPKGEGYVAGVPGPGIGRKGFLDVACDDYILQTVKQGRIGTAMMPFSGAKGLANLTDDEIGDIISYLRGLN